MSLLAAATTQQQLFRHVPLCAPSCSSSPAAVPMTHTGTRAVSGRRQQHQQPFTATARAALADTRGQQPQRRQIAVVRRRSGVIAHAVGAEGMAPQLKSAIDSLISSNKVVVFMKGTKDFPQCGFSNTVVQILRSVDAPFESVNILENEALRAGMKEYSQWPTFPQVYVDGEFYGGCDIMIEAFQSGELVETLERIKNE